jgi:superfamily II DNA or RNA helicase
MPDLTFSLDVEKKDKDTFLLIHITDKILGASRIVYADTLNRCSKEEKDLASFLLKEHLKSLGVSALSDKLATISIAKIRIAAQKSQEAIKLLALAKKLHWKGEPLFYNPFAKARVFFRVNDRNEKLTVTGFLHVDGTEYPFSFVKLFFPSNPIWCVVDRQVFALPEGVDRNMLFKTFPEPMILEGRKREDFIDLYQDEEEDIIWESAASASSAAAPSISATPILMLHDLHGAFANLMMDYGDKGIVPMHDPVGSFSDKDLEKSWEKDLLETGFQKKMVGKTHYYCPLDQVTKTLSFLLELGWKIVDAKGRRVHRHIEAKIAVTEEQDLLIAKGVICYDHHTADVQHVLGAFNRRDRFVELSPYTVGLIDPQMIEQEVGDLCDADIASDGVKLRKHQAGLLDSLLQKKHIHFDARASGLVERMKNASSCELALASSQFQGVLYPYQQEGVNWLHFLYSAGLSGLLADDMGLGKTVQLLGFLSRLEGVLPVLIVAPTSLIFNWKKEFASFLPTANIYIHEGKERAMRYEDLCDKTFILTSYAYLRQDAHLLSKLSYECVVLDEAQTIKNPDSQIAHAAFSLHGKMKIAITGTPVENRWDDLWSLFHFLEPQLLDERKEFHSHMMAAQSDERYLRRVKKKIRPFLLRRTKEDVALDLPEKVLQTVWVEMTPKQRQVYEGYLSKNRRIIREEGAEGVKRMQVLEALLRLRQLCCHPHLVEKDMEPDFEMSIKYERIMSDVSEVISEGRKVILFSQFTEMLKIFEGHVRREGWSYVYLDGSTKDREAVVREFQENPATHIFLMSLKAGGVGLNLTAADYVFLCDPWWNDAAEKQAIDRAYRLGRKDVVVARRYVTAESVEEKIMKLKEQKSALAQGLIDMEADLASFSMNELIEMIQ